MKQTELPDADPGDDAEAGETEVAVGEGGVRLDSYLAGHLPHLTRTRIQGLVKEGRVLINGEPTRPSARLRRGDRLSWTVPSAVEIDTAAQNLPLEILFEDSDLIVVNKAPGMVVHPAIGHPASTLVNALLHHCGGLSGIGGEKRPGIVHRL